FAGLRVTLVAAFNPRYHRSGLALAGALADLGCEVRRCEERLRGWNAVWRRPLVARLGAALARAPADVALVFKGTKLAPGEGGARWRAPLVFVGSRDPARERIARELADLGLVAWGPGWPRGPAYGDDFVLALSGAAVGLNIHQHFGAAGDPARYGAGANMRVF